jgi:hypothetical protein
MQHDMIDVDAQEDATSYMGIYKIGWLGSGAHGVGTKTVAGFGFGEEEDEAGSRSSDP